MKAALAVVALLPFMSAHCAQAQCATQLTPSDDAKFVPLPPSCRSIGPFKLGMTKRELFTAMGNPDGQVRKPHYGDMLIYVLPHNLNAALAKHPRTQQYFYAHEVTASVLIHAGRVVFVSVTGVRSTPAARYEMGVISVGSSINALLRQLKIQPSWNDAHDTFNLFPYPIFITALPYHGTRRVSGISIASNQTWSEAPVAVGFSFDYVPSTGLLHKYIINIESPPVR